MYFKRMELHGFKSFAEPVVIEFHQGVTCIIGPNGSGKSNISDAVRWVLGEQSPRMLRGGKMEEVIFSGTASRKSRGMAEVTLVIDNSDENLPIDYNEVAITRRMFRSGESEYFINNNQCRLRDIRELIMDTGIGVDGYSLIGQGKISDIVSSKAEGRREIFEEAAGIVMYRTRKAESERKLAAASANLERVNDIIGEIEGRIDTLKEDSAKASEYLQLRDKHKTLEINLTLSSIESLELKNEYLKDDIAELNFSLEENREQRVATDQHLTNTRQKSHNLQQAMDESQEKLMRSAQEISQLENKGRLDQERLNAIEEREVRLKSEISGLEEKFRRESDHAAELSRNKLRAEQDMQDLQRELREKNAQQEALDQELQKAAASAEQQKNDILTLHSKISSWNMEITSLENLKETLERRKRQILEEKHIGEDGNREALDAMNRLRAEKAGLEERLSQNSRELERQRRRVAHCGTEEQRLAKEMENLRISMGQFSARKKTIEEMESNYEGYNYAVRFIMKSGLTGIRGTVGELITVPRGFETAIETALGAAMQNIVCDNDQSAQTAIARLKESRAGRLTFLPVSSVRGGRGNYDSHLQQEPGFQGFGADCVVTLPEYKPVMEYLLGRVVIVDSMEHAVRLSKKAAGLRFVTLEGEIINAGGAITGGRYKNRTANLLGRKAEITDLNKKLEAGERRKTECMNSLETLRADLKECREKLEMLQEQEKAVELELVTKENQRAAMETFLNDFKASSGKWEKELDNIRSEQESSQQMIQDLEEQTQAQQRVIAEKEALVQNQLDVYDEKKVVVDKLNEDITAIRIEVGAWENKAAAADDLSRRVKRSMEELEQEKRGKEKELIHLEVEKERLLSDSMDIELVVKDKREAKENLARYLEELSQERKEAEAQAERLTEEKETLEQQARALQNQKYELEIKEAKNETQLNTYKEKLWENFEVSYVQAMSFKQRDFAMAAAVKENRQLKVRMKELGEVNLGAITEYEKVKERYEFLTAQRRDILEGTNSLSRIIADMDRTIKTRFKQCFDQVVSYFEQVFSQLFGGGHAQLRLEDEKAPLESGIEIIAQPPGKKLQNINLLSGGEKTMTAIALMFAVLKTRPTPFCILDEVEAALDDANIERFAKYLKTFDDIQFALVTHQKATMEHADVLYGVTMPEQGISKVLSLDLGDDFEI